MHILRQYIRLTLLEAHAKSVEDDRAEDLLTEPDFPDSDDEQEEQSVASNVAGYTLPLGVSNYRTSLKQRGEIAGSGFGGAKPVKKRRRRSV